MKGYTIWLILGGLAVAGVIAWYFLSKPQPNNLAQNNQQPQGGGANNAGNMGGSNAASSAIPTSSAIPVSGPAIGAASTAATSSIAAIASVSPATGSTIIAPGLPTTGASSGTSGGGSSISPLSTSGVLSLAGGSGGNSSAGGSVVAASQYVAPVAQSGGQNQRPGTRYKTSHTIYIMMHILLQADITPFVGELLKQSPVVMVLGFVSYLLWKNQQKQSADMEAMRNKHDADMQAAADKLEQYITEDRKQLLTVVQNNTDALHDIQKRLDAK